MGKIILSIWMIAICSISIAQSEQSALIKGNEWYKKNQFDKAVAEYQKAADINAKNPSTLYNLGNALYKSKKTAGAEKVYTSAADNTTDPIEKSRAVYNKGVAMTRQKKLMESIDAYKQSLRLNSTDEQARENLQKALNEIKKQPPKQGGGGGGGGDDNKKDKQPKPQPEENKSKLNQKQVEQMLNSLRQDEKKLQQFVQKKNTPGTPNGKDW